MLATLERGDTVLVPNPSYPIHIWGAVIAGADIRSVPLVPGVDFFAELESAIRGSYPKPKMIVLGFPSNPTAQCVELDFFERVVALAKQHDILVVHDLAYADIVYDGWKAPSIMQVPGAKDVAVEFFTLSKSYNMAGWRIGFMVGNRRARRRAGAHQELPRLRHVHAAAGGGDRGARRRPACVGDIAATYQRGATCSSRACTRRAGRSTCPRPRCTSGRASPSRTGTSARWNSPSSCWPRRRCRCRPASASATTATTTCAFALIENESRIRQAVRGIKAMFRSDGILQTPSTTAANPSNVA
jgi:alanine-synthesizing transaminase